MAEKVL